MNHLGLKGAFRHMKGTGIIYKLKEVYWQLRYAWQRAWRGYDNTDVFDMGYQFTNRMAILLREFKKHNDILLPNIDAGDGSSLTDVHTNAILDEMIFYFDNCDEDVVYKRLYGIYPYEDKYDYDKVKNAREEYVRCWNEAMKLFSKWCMYLWY